MLRDTHKDKHYFDEAVEFYESAIIDDVDKITSSNRTNAVKMKCTFNLINEVLSYLQVKYSRGDCLTKFKASMYDLLTYRTWQKNFADNLSESEKSVRVSIEELHQSDLRSYLKLFCFAYCLDLGRCYYLAYLELIGNQGEDALLDSIAVQLGDCERKIAPDILFNRRFGKLYEVIEGTPEQRPALAKAYLEAWYILEESLDIHLLSNDAYDGYWCWEIALLVKLFDIDDSTFINHPYYPRDLVHCQLL